MNITDINVTLAVVLVLTAAGALAVWVSPRAIDWCIKRMYARSRALSAARVTYANEWKQAMEAVREG